MDSGDKTKVRVELIPPTNQITLRMGRGQLLFRASQDRRRAAIGSGAGWFSGAYPVRPMARRLHITAH